jgi:hypothetical protein
MANGLPPGLAGYVAYNQLADREQAQKLGTLSQLIGLQQAQEQQAMAREMRPLQMDAMRAQIAERDAAGQRAQQKSMAQNALSNLVMTGGYSQNTPGASRPDAVMTDENEALQRVIQATREGRPMTVDVPNPNNVRALATMAAPEQAMGAMMKSLYPEPAKPVAPSGLSKLIAERDALPPTDPRRAIFDQAITKQTTQAPGTTVNLPKQEGEFQKSVGKEFGEIYSNSIKAEFAAPRTIAIYDRLGSLLSQVNTGKFQGTIQELKAAAKTAGVDLTAMGISDNVAPAQASAQISNMLALEMRNPAGGAGMPGAMSDKDREFLVQSIPSIANDPGAISIMIDYRKRLAKRDQEVGKMARAYRQRTGRFDEGFFDELRLFSDANPLFPPLPAGGSAARPPTAAPRTQDILRQADQILGL